jgi:ATP-binding cassette subfamily B protein
LIRLLLDNIKGYKKSAILCPLYVLVDTIIALILPSIMSNIVDIGVKNSDTAYIFKSGGLMILLSLIAAACSFTSAYHGARASNGCGSNLRTRMFYHMQSFSFSDVDRFSAASLITRTTSDVRSLQMALQQGLRVLFQAPCQLIVALVIVIYYSWKLALIYIVAIPILLIFIAVLQNMVHHLFMLVQEKLDALNSAIQENLIAIRVVKSFVRGDYERQKFKKANDELTRGNIRAVSLMIIMNPVSTIIINIVAVLVYWFGGKMVGNGELLEGELLAIITYLAQITSSILMFSMVMMQYTRSQACATRIQEVLDAVPDIREKDEVVSVPAEQRRGKVEFKNVSFKYSATGTGENVLRDINFTVEPGETVAVIGGTGSGKSSLVNLIPRFYDVTEGEVLVDGVDVRDYGIKDLRSKIGMVLQKNILFSGSVAENMRWGDENATDEEIWNALSCAQAQDFVDAMPAKLENEIQQGGSNVSGGQKQRLCIARAIIKHPSILIMDDSTSAVDSDTESRIRASFDSELGECTVFIIAQRISSVVSADKIIVLDEGGIESVGTHAELMQKSPIYQEIYNSQQEGVLGDA